MNEISIQAPAKINLGLEIIGRHGDGYHEIRTVLAMLELADTLTLKLSDRPRGMDIDGVRANENLVSRALAAFKTSVPGSSPFQWSLMKRIPAAAGLGGASSDAAAALLAANILSGSPLSTGQLMDISGTLGSDIAFFFGTPCALASGRGTNLSPVPAVESDVLLAVPRESLPAKTATMYGNLRPSDFSSGGRVATLVTGLNAGNPPSSGQLANAFARPLRALLPGTGELEQALASAGDLAFGLSGAGPAYYVLSPRNTHRQIIELLAGRFGDWLSFISTSTRGRPLHPESGASS